MVAFLDGLTLEDLDHLAAAILGPLGNGFPTQPQQPVMDPSSSNGMFQHSNTNGGWPNLDAFTDTQSVITGCSSQEQFTSTLLSYPVQPIMEWPPLSIPALPVAQSYLVAPGNHGFIPQQPAATNALLLNLYGNLSDGQN